MAGKNRENKKIPKYALDEMSEMKYSNREFMVFKDVKLSKKQKELNDLILKNKIVIATGPAGTSKTFSACYSALKLFKENKCKKIIITKPTEIVGGTDIGFLPGDLDSKLAVYKESFIGVFSDIIEGKDIKYMLDNLLIEYKPVQFIRGTTWKDSIIIVDEFQSFDIKSLMAIVTRLGKGSKIVFIGDVNQNDINIKYLAVNIFKEIIRGIKHTAIFEFDRSDIVRDPILIEITDRYEKMKSEGKLSQTKGNT